LTGNILKLTVFVVVGKGFVFLFHILLGRSLGVGKGTDMFYFVLGVISLLVFIVGAAVESSIVPVYLLRKRVGSHVEDINRLAFQLLIVLSILSMTVFYSLRHIVSGFSVFSGEDVTHIRWMLACLLPYSFLSILSSLQRGILNAEGEFIAASFLVISEGAGSLVLFVLLVGSYGILAAPLALGFGSFAGFMLGQTLLRKKGDSRLTLTFTRNVFSDWNLIFRHLSLPIVGTAIVGINPLIDQFFLSRVGEGVITSFSIASRFYYIPTTLAVGGLLPILLTRLSTHVVNRDYPGYRKLLRRVLFSLLPASVVISIVLAFLGRPLMQWVFMHSRVSEENIEMITNMFQYLQVGLSPYLASMILTRANLALRKYSLNFYCSLANVVLNIGLNVVLYARLGYVGVPLATSLTYVVIFLALYFFSRKDEGKFGSVPDPVMA